MDHGTRFFGVRYGEEMLRNHPKNEKKKIFKFPKKFPGLSGFLWKRTKVHAFQEEHNELTFDSNSFCESRNLNRKCSYISFGCPLPVIVLLMMVLSES